MAELAFTAAAGTAVLHPLFAREFRLEVAVTPSSDAVGGRCGVVLNAPVVPSACVPCSQLHGAGDTVSVWMETAFPAAGVTKRGTKQYAFAGRGLRSQPGRSKRYPVSKNPGGFERPAATESWQITMDGEKGHALLNKSKVEFRFLCAGRAPDVDAVEPQEAVAFFYVGPAGTAAHFRVRVTQRDGQDAWQSLNKSTLSLPSLTAASVTDRWPSESKDSRPASNSSRRSGRAPIGRSGSDLVRATQQLFKYQERRPAKVFMPAVEAAHEEKRKVVTGVYEKHVPWHIAPSYHETDPFKSLVLQKQQKETYKLPPVKKTVNKATAKDGGDKESHLGDDDSSDGDGPMDKATLALLRERFNIFDNLNTGWIDSKDVPVVFGQFYYYAQRPEELGRAALLKYDPDYYTALEWPEFVEVAGHFLTLEKEELVSLAQSAGTDGHLGLDAVRSLAKSLGEDFFPWAISEVLGGDDQTVDEEGFVDAVRKLRKTAGFTSEERDELMGAWGKFCPAEVDPSPQAGSKLYLPLPKFKNLLQYQSYNVDVFDDFLIKIGQRDKPIRHDDFLWAVRMFRNELTSSYEKVFHASDFDRSGEIEINELYDCLKRLGFYCNAKAVQEAMDIVDRDKTGGMSFDEFILLMQHLRKSEGFTKAEIDEFESLHAKFDTDNDGEISTLELGFLLRYLGMPTNLDMLQKNLYEVDVDGSGSMDMGELLKLMRKFRNDEEYTTEATFSALAEVDCDEQGNPLHDPPQYYIAVEVLPNIIAAMGYEPTPHMVGLARKLPPWCFFPQTNLAGFKTFTVAYRDLERSEFHVRAGFTEEQVEEYRTSFQAYDRSGDGEMSVNEIMPLLKDLGRAPQTPKQRDRLAQMLDEIDEDKTGEISFDEFLQLMRKFCDEQDVEKLAKEERLKQKAKFKDDEVEQWRAIFIKFDSGGEQEMGLPDVKTVLGAVGVNTNVREPAEDLKKKFYAADQDGSETLDFPEFLLLMRALLDADFGGIATRKDLVKKKK